MRCCSRGSSPAPAPVRRRRPSAAGWRRQSAGPRRPRSRPPARWPSCGGWSKAADPVSGAGGRKAVSPACADAPARSKAGTCRPTGHDAAPWPLQASQGPGRGPPASCLSLAAERGSQRGWRWRSTWWLAIRDWAELPGVGGGMPGRWAACRRHGEAAAAPQRIVSAVLHSWNIITPISTAWRRLQVLAAPATCKRGPGPQRAREALIRSNKEHRVR